MSFALNRSGGEDAWPEPPEVFVHQLADEIGERRRPAPDGRRFRLSFALVAAVALLLPLAAFADQAGDNLARREDSAEVELVATDDDDDGGGGDSDSDSETSVAGQYDVGGDSDSDSSGHVGEYDVGGGDDSEDSDSGSDDGHGGQQPALPQPQQPAGGDDSTDDGGGAQQAPAPAPADAGGGGDDTDDSDD